MFSKFQGQDITLKSGGNGTLDLPTITRKRLEVALTPEHVNVQVLKKLKETGQAVVMTAQALNGYDEEKDASLQVFQEDKNCLDQIMLNIVNLYNSNIYLLVLMYDYETKDLACIYPQRRETIDKITEMKELKPNGKLTLNFKTASMQPNKNSLQFVVWACTDESQVSDFVNKYASQGCTSIRRVVLLQDKIQEEEETIDLEQSLQKLDFKE